MYLPDFDIVAIIRVDRDTETGRWTSDRKSHKQIYTDRDRV